MSPETMMGCASLYPFYLAIGPCTAGSCTPNVSAIVAEDSGAGFARLIDEWQTKPALQLTRDCGLAAGRDLVNLRSLKTGRVTRTKNADRRPHYSEDDACRTRVWQLKAYPAY
jgi:hypothetical protein